MKPAARTRTATWIAFGLACVARRKWPATVRNVTIAIAASLGLAHGAADDTLVAAAFRSRRFAKPLVTIGYAAIAASTFALAYRSPNRAAPILTGLTWYHFGSGDVAFAAACGQARSAAAWIVRGALPVAGPRPLRALTTLVALAQIYRAVRRRRYADAVDLALPGLCFCLADGPDTFLAYFALWHAPRHVAVVLQRYSGDGALRERIRTYVAAAIPNVLVALLAGLPVFALAPTTRARCARALILAITVPHLAAVAWLDQRANKRPRGDRANQVAGAGAGVRSSGACRGVPGPKRRRT